MQQNRKEELQIAIAEDAEAKSAFDQLRFVDCARRLKSVLPRERKPLPLSEMGIIALYESDPETGFAILEKLDAVAAINPRVKRIVRYMAPGTAESMLPDFSMAPIRQALTAPVEYGGIGLSESQARLLLEAGEQPPAVDPIDIEQLWRQHAHAN